MAGNDTRMSGPWGGRMRNPEKFGRGNAVGVRFLGLQKARVGDA